VGASYRPLPNPASSRRPRRVHKGPDDSHLSLRRGGRRTRLPTFSASAAKPMFWPSRQTPTRPYTITLDEQLDMRWSASSGGESAEMCLRREPNPRRNHRRLPPGYPSRPGRPISTSAPPIRSHGPIGEVITPPANPPTDAHPARLTPLPLPAEPRQRQLRIPTIHRQYTINPAIAPRFWASRPFRIEPESSPISYFWETVISSVPGRMGIKGGFIAWSPMAIHASIPTPPARLHAPHVRRSFCRAIGPTPLHWSARHRSNMASCKTMAWPNSARTRAQLPAASARRYEAQQRHPKIKSIETYHSKRRRCISPANRPN